MTYEEIMEMEPLKLQVWLESEFSAEIPPDLSEVTALREAERLLSRFGTQLSYLGYLQGFAKIYVRETRRAVKAGRLPKSAEEDAVDRKNSVDQAAESVKALKEAVSRMVTVRQAIAEEENASGAAEYRIRLPETPGAHAGIR